MNGQKLDIAYSSQGDVATAHVNNYAITGVVSNGTGLASDYTVNLTNGTLAVNPAALTIAANSKGMTYGGTLPTLTASVHGPGQRRHAGQPDHAAHACHDAGQQPRRVLHDHRQRGGRPGLLHQYVSGTLTIGQAALKITANSKGMTYGGTLPTLTAGYTGLVNGDTPASLSTLPTLSTAPASSHAGSYTITASAAVDPDYSITTCPAR